MKSDIDFQLESMVWLRSTRGDDFVDQLSYSVQVHGPEAALADVLHGTMSSDEQKTYAAAIEFIEWSPLQTEQQQPLSLLAPLPSWQKSRGASRSRAG